MTASSDILLLIGTQTGNAEMVAEDVADVFGARGLSVHLVDMADAYPELLAAYQRVVICTSTWGEGELPDNALDLYDGLTAVQPDLSHIAYGVVALGDRIYDPHFCEAAHIFEKLLGQLGATRLIDTHEIDAGPSAHDIKAAQAWAERCAEAFASTLASDAPAAL